MKQIKTSCFIVLMGLFLINESSATQLLEQNDSFYFIKEIHSVKSISFKRAIHEFYQKRNYLFFWLNSNEPKNLRRLQNAVEHYEDDGMMICPKIISEFRDKNNHVIHTKKDSVHFEILATRAFLTYANLCWNGFVTEQRNQSGWNKTAKKISNDVFLKMLLNSANLFEHPPVFFQYGLLKKYLYQFLVKQREQSTAPIKELGKYPSFGESSDWIGAFVLKCKLHVSFPIASVNKYDSGLFHTIRYLQQRFGLEPNGKIDHDLVKQLNVPIAKRINQIILNMERCRWIEIHNEPLEIVVNIPDFAYYLIDHEKRIWIKKIIVGKEYQPTAIFNAKMESIVFCPYWNIPPGIFKSEIMPAINRNPGYMAKHDMEWYGAAIRQRPGPNNPLGNIKFLFPNRFNMYMHDTPGKDLFKLRKRTFSHGCMRIENAIELASFLLNKEGDWSRQKMESLIKSGQEKIITLKHVIPVHITYLTSWVDENGEIRFRNDVYGYDSKLWNILSISSLKNDLLQN